MAFQRLLLCLFGLLSAIIPAVLAQTACNGRVEYCSRSYSNVSFIGAHDSPFVGSLPTDNQDLNVTADLDYGIRFLQGQTHQNLEGELDLCHTNCLLKDAGSLVSFLQTVKTWLDTNPNEVLTLLITNGDNLDIGRFDTAFTDSGIKPYVYVPPTSPNVLPIDSWPTLQELIDAGTRVVTFLDYGANMASVPYILDEFSYFFETAFDVTDASFPDCSINRPPGASATGRMYIVNHFLDVDILGVLVPDVVHAGRTNAATGAGSIGAQADLCESLYGRPPNFVLVDFTDQGDVFGAQNALNGF